MGWGGDWWVGQFVVASTLKMHTLLPSLFSRPLPTIPVIPPRPRVSPPRLDPAAATVGERPQVTVSAAVASAALGYHD